MNFKQIKNFITDKEREAILEFASQEPEKKDIENDHIRKINDLTKGWSTLYDVTKTDVSKQISKFQGDATVVDTIPEIFLELGARIADQNIDPTNVFFQYIVVNSGGKVYKHYDAGMPGYITYKCNICVDGPEPDEIYVGKDKFELENKDLYCFEANFYKHWLETSDTKRVHLSYGFIIPYSAFGWDEEDSRVRLSNRIWQKFIKEMNI